MSPRQDPTRADLERRAAAVAAAQVEQVELAIASVVASIEDMAQLSEWRSRASALEAYLRSRELQRPILGAQRRIEGRIGQLLGEAREGRPVNNSERVQGLDDHQRLDFRLLGRALAGEANLTAEEWRKSRRALVALDRLQWCHCAYAGDDVEEVKALAATAKIALENALYGLGTDPLEPVEEWMLPRPGWARQ